MKEQIAAGLRQMKTTPDLLLYCGNKGDRFYYNISSMICGIAVVHSSLVENCMTDSDVPWIPIWFDPGDYILERKCFNEGYAL